MIALPDIFMYTGKKPYRAYYPSIKPSDELVGVKCMTKTYNFHEKFEAISTISGLEPHEDGCYWIKNIHGFDWNPFEDDGDAFRLATHLRMTLGIGMHEVVASYDVYNISYRLSKGDDANQALRIAIFEVAFEIYKRTML